MNRICLVMIVKDEEAVISRCLDSVLPFVDYAVIVDTGSTDQTKEEVLAAGLKHNRGICLTSKPWVDYAHNRNQALAEARRLLETRDPSSDAWQDDYLLVMDADDVLQTSWAWARLSPMGADGYYGTYQLGELEFKRPILVKAGVDWRYYFPVHELLMRSEDDVLDLPDSGLVVQCNVGGDYQGRDHFMGHVEILERYMKEHPDCTRSQFYLAQSLQCAGEHNRAIQEYAKRTQMSGYAEERVVSWLRIGELSKDPGAFLEAAAMNETRVEGLLGAARWCFEKGWPMVARSLLDEAVNRLKTFTPCGLFLDTDAPRRLQLLYHDLRP